MANAEKLQEEFLKVRALFSPHVIHPPRFMRALSSWPRTPSQAVAHLPLLCSPSIAASTAVLPALYDQYTSAVAAASTSSDSLTALLCVLLAKRVTLYMTAALTVFVAALRSADAPSGLGERLEQVTEEAVAPLSLPASQSEEVRAVARSLDDTSAASQAAALPVVFGLLLAGAYATTNFLGAVPDDLPRTDTVLDATAAFRAIQPFSTATVCFFCLNIEAQASGRALFGSGTEKQPAGSEESEHVAPYACAAAALIGVAAAYLLPSSTAWPLQNTINGAIAINVARALQLPTLPTILAALAGLTLYDAVGTLASPASAAADAASTLASAPQQQSVMESVATARIGNGAGAAWQPGLMVVLLQGRITDGLGLGDIVAPSILAGWAHRFDRALCCRAGDPSESDSGGYLRASLGGYALGCVLLEVAPVDISRAALLLLIPCMSASLLASLAVKGDLEAALQFGGGSPRRDLE